MARRCELVRAHGFRRSRYRGFAKVDLQNLLIGIACNIKRWPQVIATIKQPFLKALGRAVLQPFSRLATRLHDLVMALDSRPAAVTEPPASAHARVRSAFNAHRDIPVNHAVIQWKGVELIIRTETVDRESVYWMGASLFWKLFEEGATGSRDVVLDLGAHIGSFGILASHTRGCRVVAFEPDRDSMRLCRANALLNGIEDRFEFVEAAVGGSNCAVQLYKAFENWGHTIYSSGGPHHLLTGLSVDVPCYSLKRAVDAGNCEFCAFVKVNIEGAEFEMIEQTDEETLSRIGALAAEVHYDLVKRSPEHIISKLRRANFNVRLEPAGERAILLAWR
jgi:FkbM family methyltransferase